MNFAVAAKRESAMTTTENGAAALNTTGDARLDFFSQVGALRGADEVRIHRLFSEAYKQDPLFATKIAFYARDIRGGLGERDVFRTLIRYMANRHPESIRPNINVIGEFGRYDDLYSLIGTPVEDDMWAFMKEQFEKDRESLELDEFCPVSLLAKWIKTADATSMETRRLGILTAEKLGYNVYAFKRIVRALRKRIDVVEARMSAGEWEKINYSGVPSNAMLRYRNAFARHDRDRFNEFLTSAVEGKATIHSGTLFPYEIVRGMIGRKYMHAEKETGKKALEAQWKSLPDYVKQGTNAIVIADTSGSMTTENCVPLFTAVSLAVYFAERNTGDYHNMFMSFSADSRFHLLKGETLEEKLNSIDMHDWGMNTNLYAAFRHILDVAKENNVPKEEMPKSLIVVSDMEIDCAVKGDWLFYDGMSKEFAENGYEIPNVIFWNVASRHDVFHADKDRAGVQLVSGHSASTFFTVMDCIGKTPVEAMESTINSDRYAAIKVG